jgi:hypothetical protein
MTWLAWGIIASSALGMAWYISTAWSNFVQLVAVTEVNQRRAGDVTQLVQVIVLPGVPQVGDLAEQLPPVVGLTIADMQGAHLVEPWWIVPLHLVEVDGTALGNPQAFRLLKYSLPTRWEAPAMTSAPARPEWRSASSKAIWPPSL